MAFKIFATRGATTHVLAANRRDLCDPRINKMYPIDGVPVTNEQYFNWARQLSSTENITNNSDFFAANSTFIIPSYNGTFLEKVPADLHQYAFMLSYSYSQWDGRYTDQRYVPTYDTYAGYIYGVNTGGNAVDTNNASYWTSVILYLSTVKDFFQGTVWNAVKSTAVSHSTAYGDGVFRSAAYLMNGYRYITRTSGLDSTSMLGSSLVSADVAGEILAGDNGDVQLHWSTDRGWMLICPVSIRNKSSLYQVFSASQDVTAILGKGAAAKKTIIRAGKEVDISSKAPRLYGVELELTSEKPVRQMIDLQGDPVFFLAKSDSSISGSKRFKYECVTIPMELVDQRKCWTRFFANVGEKNDFDVTTQTSNGMHVHVGRQNFTDKHLKQFTWFITAPENREFILLISQRSQESFDRWSPAPNYKNYRTYLEAYKGCVGSVAGLRGAVNVGNTRQKPTVEVRIFKGIVSCAEVLRNLEVVDAIFEYTRPISEGGTSSIVTLNIQGFYDWVKATPKNKYKMLRADLWKLDIPSLIKKARTVRLLFNISDPEQMVKRVNAEADRTEHLKTGKYEIDKIVYATVTRIIGRRCLAVDDDGKLKVIQKAVGRIAHLDEKLIQSYDKQTKAAK